MSAESPPDPTDDASGLVIEALSREDGNNSTVRVFRDRIEWIKKETISSLPRPKSDQPVIPLASVQSVRAKKDGPLFSKVVVRTPTRTIVFRMHSPQAVEVRDAIAELVAAGPPPLAEVPEQVGAAAPAGAATQTTAEDDLQQLQWLRDEGMLTAEQFESARAELESR